MNVFLYLKINGHGIITCTGTLYIRRRSQLLREHAQSDVSWYLINFKHTHKHTHPHKLKFNLNLNLYTVHFLQSV